MRKITVAQPKQKKAPKAACKRDTANTGEKLWKDQQGQIIKESKKATKQKQEKEQKNDSEVIPAKPLQRGINNIREPERTKRPKELLKS